MPATHQPQTGAYEGSGEEPSQRKASAGKSKLRASYVKAQVRAKYGAPKPTEDPTATATARALGELESLKRRIEELESLNDRKKRNSAMSATQTYRPSGEKGDDDEGGRESEMSEDEDADDEPVVDPLMKHVREANLRLPTANLPSTMVHACCHTHGCIVIVTTSSVLSLGSWVSIWVLV